MGILDRVLSALGLRSEGSDRDRGETTRPAGRVERERSAAEREEPATHSPAAETEGEPAAADTEAAASTGSMVDAEEGVEPAEAAGPGGGAGGTVAEESEEGEEETTAGSGEPSAETETEAEGEGEGEPAAAETEAAASTGSMVDAEEGVEPAEAAGPGGEDASGADVVSPEHVDDAPDTIKGIGPAYAERLADAGVTTVGELAVADAASVAEATGISEKRVSRWIERARAR